MDRKFTDWYRIIDPNALEDRLKRRWAGIEAFIQRASEQQLQDAIRVFYGLVPTGESFLDDFATDIYNADKSFSQSQSGKEVSVLAGVAAFQAAQASKNLSVFLAFVCGKTLGLGTKYPIEDFISLSEQKLQAVSHALRSDLVTPRLKSPQKPIEALKGALADHNQVKDQTAAALSDIVQYQKGLFQYCKDIEKFTYLQKEELDIMWWLYGEYSPTANAYFDEMSQEDACIALALDIADLTFNLPGPLAAKAYLKKALKSCKQSKDNKTSIEKIVKNSSKAIKEKHISSGTTLSGLTPLHECIHNFSTQGEGSEWHKVGNKKSLTLEIQKDIYAIDFAHQIYRESLLLSAISSDEE